MVTFAVNTSIVQTSTSLVLAAGTIATQPLSADDGITDGITGGDGLLDLAGPSAGEDIYVKSEPRATGRVAAPDVRTAEATPVDASLSPLQAGLAVLAGAMLPAPALAAGVEASAGVSAPLVHLIGIGILFSIPITRLAVRAVRGFVNLVRRPPEEAERASDSFRASGAGGVGESSGVAVPHYINRANRWLGRLEMRIAPFRDNPLLWTAIAAGSLALDPYRSLIGYLPPLATIGLSLYSRAYRLRTVDATLMARVQDQPILAAAWDRTRENAIGPLGRDIPTTFPASDHYRVGERRFTGPAETDRRASRAALRETLRYSWFIVRQVRDREGFFRFWWQIANFLFGRMIPANREIAEQGTAVVRQWAIHHAEHQKTNIEVRGTEKLSVIPDRARVFWAGAHHDSLWPNYYGAFMQVKNGALQGIRPVADFENYYRGRKLKFVAPLPVALAKLGLFFVPRGETDDFDWVEDMRTKMDLGLQPIIYPQGGRVPRAYHEDGTLDTPGLYANVVSRRGEDGKIKHPELYLNNGIARQTTSIADQTGQTVYVPILKMSGGYRIDPKRTPNVVKPMPVTTNQTMAFEVAEVIEVQPGETVDTVMARIEAALERATQANALLQARVAEWEQLDAAHRNGLAAEFNRRAAEDVRYYAIADRIRSIPPGEERRRYQETLFALLRRPHDEPGVVAFINTVAEQVKAVEYD